MTSFWKLSTRSLTYTHWTYLSWTVHYLLEDKIFLLKNLKLLFLKVEHLIKHCRIVFLSELRLRFHCSRFNNKFLTNLSIFMARTFYDTYKCTHSGFYVSWFLRSIDSYQFPIDGATIHTQAMIWYIQMIPKLPNWNSDELLKNPFFGVLA